VRLHVREIGVTPCFCALVGVLTDR
jgi:hypothetical protein